MDNVNYGWGKFRDADEDYFKYIEKLLESDISKLDLIYQFPVFVGHVNIARHLFFYELYKNIKDLNGHIADVGTYKGASFLFMAKLVRLFESYNTTQVLGFDWFEGMQPSQVDDIDYQGTYIADYDTLLKLIELQKLQDVALLHKLDLTKDLNNFFEQAPHLRFKMVFIDCGIAEVLEKSLKSFWPRLVNGGILILDHYNCEVSPSESSIVEKHVGNNLIKQMPFNRQPTCYIVKESR